MRCWPRIAFVIGAVVVVFVGGGARSVVAQEWTWSGAGAWAPSSSYLNAIPTTMVPLDAAVTDDPPAVTLRFFQTGTFRVYRKGPFESAWGAYRASVTVASVPSTWTDTNVVAGVLYEYGVGGSSSTRADYRGNVLAGIRADRTQPLGRFAVVVSEDVIARLPEEYARYKDDLVEEGWTVHEVVVPRAPNYTSNGTGPNDANGVPTAPFPDAHIQIRNQLIALYQLYPGELKNVALVGKVPVARSGVGYLGPDGHGNRLAAGADAYYADMDGVWADTGNNLGQYPVGTERSNAVADGRINVAGDNKFDANNMSDVKTPNSSLELGFGRIDFSNLIPGEFESLRTYFDKLHRYKRAAADFRPGRRVLNRTAPAPTGPDVQLTMLRAMPGVVGMENVALLRYTDPGTLPLGDPNAGTSFAEDADSAYSRLRGPFLFYFKGSGGPGLSTDGRAVFWTGLQSSWGYWYMPNYTTIGYNTMPLRIAEENFTLSFTWSIWGPEYLYHRLGMGFDAGDMMRVSMSDRYTATGRTPIYEYSQGPLYMNHIGCPSLRVFMFPGPSRLGAFPAGGHPSLFWQASPEPGVLGYHVYRAADAGGPYTRVTGAPVAGTNYVDAAVSSGQPHYLVRAVRLETSGGGTFYNASLGVRTSIDLDAAPDPIALATAALPDARWNRAYSAALQATGGYSEPTWRLVSGALPPGLALSADGVVSGTPETAGDFAFTVRATDAAGAAGEGIARLTVLPSDAQVFHPAAGRSIRGNDGTLGGLGEAVYSVSGPTYDWATYLRFDLAGLDPHQGVRRARLRLTLDEKIQVDNINLLQLNLSRLGANWQDSTIVATNAPPDDTASPTVAPVGLVFPVAFGVLEFDVTELVRRALGTDPGQRVGFRLHSHAPNGFGLQTRFANRHGAAGGRPTLTIETSDAPAIAFRRPGIKPASIVAGSNLALSAQVDPLPERAGSLVLRWSQVDGPGAVVFGPTDRADTWATFPAAGHYTLRLRAEDGVLWAEEDLEVRVLPPLLTPAYGPDDGLLVRLAFDETAGTSAADRSGAALATPGTLATIGATGLPQWRPGEGRLGGALAFDGQGQRVEVPDSSGKPLDGMQRVSVSAWIRHASDEVLARAIVSKRGTSTASTTSYALGLSSARRLTASIGSSALTGTTVLSTSRWYHVAMVYDGSLATQRLKLFINGLPEVFGTVTATNLLRSASVPLRVGDYTATAVSSSFNGLIDEVRVYGRALGQDELLLLASMGPATVGARISLPQGSVTGETARAVGLLAEIDDGGFGPANVAWTHHSGPGGAVFSAPFAPATEVTADTAGDHVFRITADNGSVATWADLPGAIASAPGVTLAQWRQRHFSTTANEGEAADDANPMGDGLPNLLKYALGLDPRVDYRGSALNPMERAAVERIGDRDYVTITLVRDTRVHDATLFIDVTDDIEAGEWTPLSPLNPDLRIRVQADEPEPGMETITVRDSTPLVDGASSRFLRLRAVPVP